MKNEEMIAIDEKMSICAELLEKVIKHETLLDEINADVVRRLKDAVQSYKKMQEFGIEFRAQFRSNWYGVSEHEHIALYGKNHNRTIPCLDIDNGVQPEDEWLYSISFPSGPYVFCEKYLEKLFDKMWTELKELGPRYCDTTNRSMYFTSDNSAMVHDQFSDILKKYHKEASSEVARLKIEEMEAELDRLKGDGL